MKIVVINDELKVIFELNDSNAAKDLYNQLPLELEVEPFSKNEITFYPEPLDTTQTPLVKKAVVGTIAYFEPYKDVCMFYDVFGAYPGLYHLGEAVFGENLIKELKGKVRIEKYDED